MAQYHWLPGFNYNVEESDAVGLSYETLAIWRQRAGARAVFKVAIEEKRTHTAAPGGDWRGHRCHQGRPGAAGGFDDVIVTGGQVKLTRGVLSCVAARERQHARIVDAFARWRARQGAAGRRHARVDIGLARRKIV